MKQKTFLIIIIIAIAFIVSVLGSYAYFSMNNVPVVNQSQSASVIIQNYSSTSNQAPSSNKETKTNLISAQRAIDIVEQSNPNKSAKIRFSAELVQNGGAPYYLVTVYDNDPKHSTYRQGIGGAKVDARTGIILDEMG